MDKVEDDPRWWGVVFWLGRMIRLKAIQDKDTEIVEAVNENWKDVYQDYLKSHQWKAKAKQAKEKAGNRCQLCNSKKNLHVHHRTYDHIGMEPLEDLTVLCADCHAMYHDYHGGIEIKK